MIHVTTIMYRYLRRILTKQSNVHNVHRTISGLDKHHIASRKYIDSKKSGEEIVSSLKLLNIFGEGTLSRYPPPLDYNTYFINLWCGGLWCPTKTPHLSYQKPSDPSVLSKANNPPPVSQRNSSSPPLKSSP